MRLYVVRHGETDYNKERKIQGHINIPLNENGKNQAIKVRDDLKNKHIDLIITSPLDRAFTTASIISDGKIPIVKDKRLKERYLGTLEGANVEKYDRFKYNDMILNFTEENVESVRDVYNRVGSLLRNIDKYNKNNILLVTHSGIMNSIYYYFNELPENKNLYRQIANNCEVLEYNL